MDSGCTQHITTDLSNCESLHDIDTIKVHLANDNVVEAKKEGVVRMVMEPRKGGIQTQLLLNKVLYVPDAGVNMISCTQLDKSDISTIIEGGECVLVDRKANRCELGYAKRRQSDHLFVLQGTVSRQSRTSMCSVIGNVGYKQSGEELWHRRLGHISKSRARQLAAGIVEGIDMNAVAEQIDCNTCVETKQSKSPASGSLSKGQLNHTIHSDMIGPISPSTIGGARYILCFIVETSRYAKVFIIKERSQLRQCFKQFLAWIERVTTTSIKRLHSDGAKEYVQLGSYLKELGITQTFSTPYTPQSNGLAERYNRTLLDKIRSMIHDAGLSMKFWGETALHAAYLTNVTGGKGNPHGNDTI